MKQEPRISVILPVYNGQDYIHEAISSILNQTFLNFELIIINDGSTDQTDSIIKSFTDLRLRYLSRENKGLAYTLRELVFLAKSNLIARMDADDISEKNRLELQYNRFKNDQELVLVGGNVRYIDDENNLLGVSTSPTINKAIRNKLRSGNIIYHPTVMFKKDIYLKTVGYSQVIDKYIEDYLLWVEIIQYGKVEVIKDIVLSYRVHANAISSTAPSGLSVLISKINTNGGAYPGLKEDYARVLRNKTEIQERFSGRKLNNLVRNIIIFLKNIYFSFNKGSL
ncbi:glycosyltransferase [Pseudoalteromonas sp. NGC95]|uniref:glycosyltransferase n=1 Tax=Pseudoalteromonas sp. NGC95 TaxID=2792051 RepID=UPI0018CE6013|nr:glycosyltransferase [Pseudoalteromonas sp. NGC95]MBH0015101.1 glycosyltransferase [Pseudoalteromonas sp. NGC95]